MRIEDIAAAQVLLHEQLKTDWAKLLNGLALGGCPALSQILRPLEPEYYWSADETGGRRTSCLNRLRHGGVVSIVCSSCDAGLRQFFGDEVFG
ncbi:MAG: hypothetical protein HS127_00665 [Planctomycetia bacterium]|nr:hypothetical protein [Planctomycetia bacterium]